MRGGRRFWNFFGRVFNRNNISPVLPRSLSSADNPAADASQRNQSTASFTLPEFSEKEFKRLPYLLGIIDGYQQNLSLQREGALTQKRKEKLEKAHNNLLDSWLIANEGRMKQYASTVGMGLILCFPISYISALKRLYQTSGDTPGKLEFNLDAVKVNIFKLLVLLAPLNTLKRELTIRNKTEPPELGRSSTSQSKENVKRLKIAAEVATIESFVGSIFELTEMLAASESKMPKADLFKKAYLGAVSLSFLRNMFVCSANIFSTHYLSEFKERRRKEGKAEVNTGLLAALTFLTGACAAVASTVFDGAMTRYVKTQFPDIEMNGKSFCEFLKDEFESFSKNPARAFSGAQWRAASVGLSTLGMVFNTYLLEKVETAYASKKEALEDQIVVELQALSPRIEDAINAYKINGVMTLDGKDEKDVKTVTAAALNADPDSQEVEASKERVIKAIKDFTNNPKFLNAAAQPSPEDLLANFLARALLEGTIPKMKQLKLYILEKFEISQTDIAIATEENVNDLDEDLFDILCSRWLSDKCIRNDHNTHYPKLNSIREFAELADRFDMYSDNEFEEKRHASRDDYLDELKTCCSNGQSVKAAQLLNINLELEVDLQKILSIACQYGHDECVELLFTRLKTCPNSTLGNGKDNVSLWKPLAFMLANEHHQTLTIFLEELKKLPSEYEKLSEHYGFKESDASLELAAKILEKHFDEPVINKPIDSQKTLLLENFTNFLEIASTEGISSEVIDIITKLKSPSRQAMQERFSELRKAFFGNASEMEIRNAIRIIKEALEEIHIDIKGPSEQKAEQDEHLTINYAYFFKEEDVKEIVAKTAAEAAVAAENNATDDEIAKTIKGSLKEKLKALALYQDTDSSPPEKVDEITKNARLRELDSISNTLAGKLKPTIVSLNYIAKKKIEI